MRLEKPFLTGFWLALGVSVGLVVLPLIAGIASAVGLYWLANLLG